MLFSLHDTSRGVNEHNDATTVRISLPRCSACGVVNRYCRQSARVVDERSRRRLPGARARLHPGGHLVRRLAAHDERLRTQLGDGDRPVPDGSSVRMDTLLHAEGEKATLKKDVSQIRAMLTCLQKSRSI